MYNVCMSNATHLKATDRRKISNSLHKSAICGGNQKVTRLGTALADITSRLSDAGFSLDVVSADTIMGEKGSRQLSFRPTNNTDDAFFEHARIENSFINFTWENLANDDQDKSFEIIAYVS